jgi:hypothetical protein
MKSVVFEMMLAGMGLGMLLMVVGALTLHRGVFVLGATTTMVCWVIGWGAA